MAKITEFNTGYCTHPECVVTNKLSLKKKAFPAKAWLIETNNKKYLWDTGYAKYFFKNKWNHKLYGFVTPVYTHAREHLAHQLKSLNINHDDIDAIFVSHLHADHCAGLLDFPISKVYLHQDCASLLKQESTIKLLLNGSLPDLFKHLYTAEGDVCASGRSIETGTKLHYFNELANSSLPKELAPFDNGYKVAEDFYIVDLPGHAVGHVGAFIFTGTEWLLLASDSAWVKEAYLEQQYPSKLADIIMHDRFQYEKTLVKIGQLANNGCRIVLSHEEETHKEIVIHSNI